MQYKKTDTNADGYKLDDLYAKNQIISNQSNAIDEFIDDFSNRSKYHKIIVDLIGYISTRKIDGLLYHKDDVINYIKENKLLKDYKDLFAIWDKLYQFKDKFESIKTTINNIREKPGINQEIANTLHLKQELADSMVEISNDNPGEMYIANNLETEVYSKINNIKYSIKQLESLFIWRIMRSFDSIFKNIYHNYLYINKQLKDTKRSSKVTQLFVDEFLKDDDIFSWDLRDLTNQLKNHYYNYLDSKKKLNQNNDRKVQDLEWDRLFFKNNKTIFQKLNKEYSKNQKELEDLLPDEDDLTEKEDVRQDIITNIYKIWTTIYFSTSRDQI